MLRPYPKNGEGMLKLLAAVALLTLLQTGCEPVRND